MIKILSKIITFSALISSMSFAKSEEGNTISIASNVNLERYSGRWYAITSLPQRFTSECVAQTADYDINNSGDFLILNTCYKADGSTSSLSGTAVSLNAPNNSELEIDFEFDSFFANLFAGKGDYIIFKLDPQYRYALIGSRDFKSLWLLSRNKTVSKNIYNEYISRAQEIGFDTNKLVDSIF